MEITIKKAAHSRIKEVNFKNLEFGKHVADHMFEVDYADGEWKELRIVPFGNLSLSPAMIGLHYGQIVFEGMKAFRMADGRISVFRPDKHGDRFNKSLDRMCMPAVPEELFISGIHKLIELDTQWVPKEEDSSLYIRPFMFATEERLGVKVSDEYKFMILTSPVGPYYARPLRVKVELEYVRAAEGGAGFAKCAGNYGASFYPSRLARKEGYDQLIWTDSKEHQYVDEAGTMNLMFVIDGTLVTPPLSTTILDGVTRSSILQLASDMNFPFEERKVSIAEMIDSLKKGSLKEAFGAGTAAVVSPIQTIGINGNDYDLPAINNNGFTMRAKKQLSDIRIGKQPDIHGWNYII